VWSRDSEIKFIIAWSERTSERASEAFVRIEWELSATALTTAMYENALQKQRERQTDSCLEARETGSRRTITVCGWMAGCFVGLTHVMASLCLKCR